MISSFDTVVQRLRFLADPASHELTDTELLTRFQKYGDQAAFATIVARHGAAVFAVCRRVLQHQQNAEDAFQATFLVFARKAPSIRQASSLGCWLYGVAYRVASKCKSQLGRHVSQPLPDLAIDSHEIVSRELRQILDDELSQLPQRLREPIVLCYVDGLSRDEAAGILGCKLSTFRGRLEDGRERYALG
jgi:RNA polymerase sigma factor (sigma-70 family)